MAVLFVVEVIDVRRLVFDERREVGPGLEEAQVCCACWVGVGVDDGEGGGELCGEVGVEADAVDVEGWGVGLGTVLDDLLVDLGWYGEDYEDEGVGC